jgi:uncharacterized UPF0160 family protein
LFSTGTPPPLLASSRHTLTKRCRVYEKLMAEIDAIDNGYAAYDAGVLVLQAYLMPFFGSKIVASGVKPKYDVGGSIGHRWPS